MLQEHYAIDIADQRPRSIDDGRRFDRVVTLCDKAREALPDSTYGTRTHWSIPDPAADDLYPSFVSAAAEIDTRVRHLLPSLRMEN